MPKFKVEDPVRKTTGEYHVAGEVRSVFTTKKGTLRYVVEIEAALGGSFLHIYNEGQLELDLEELQKRQGKKS